MSELVEFDLLLYKAVVNQRRQIVNIINMTHYILSYSYFARNSSQCVKRKHQNTAPD